MTPAADELPPDLDPPPPEPPPPWVEFARAPLVPVAVAVTLGLVLDRFVGVPTLAGLGAAAVAVGGWWFARGKPFAAVLLWVAAAGLAAAYHHAHRHEFPPDDIGRFAQVGPTLVKVRGVLADDPITRKHTSTDPFSPIRKSDLDIVPLDVTAVEVEQAWQPASGRVRLWVDRDLPADAPPLNGLHPGDGVQAVGMLHAPQPPTNPGERDARDRYLDGRLRGDLRTSDTSAAVVRLDADETNPSRWLAAVRGYGAGVLDRTLGDSRAAVGRALLLGDGSAMDRGEWDAFVRTGVVHVLVISGQHLVLLGGGVWLALQVFGMSRRQAAWAVVAVVIGYAVLTGLRPSTGRAAAMVVCVCGAVLLRRPLAGANTFAAAWLAVVALNPTDAFDLGCRLSFLAVFVLVWGVGRWVEPPPLTPWQQLLREAEPPWKRWARRFLRPVVVAYAVNLAIFASNAPLLAADQNVASPVSLLVGPVLVFLSEVALAGGFLLLLLAPIPIVADVCAFAARWAIAAAEWVVRWADGLPGGCVYLPGPPGWWQVGFHALVVTGVLLGWRTVKRFAVVLAAWVLLLLVLPTPKVPAGEFRVTFLSVEHGGCAVMETDDGRVLLYDVGTTAGPDVVRRVIAPYLWHRGVRRIDELFVSHADADHFNGIGELVRRFPVGRVTFTPSFAEKPTAEVAETLLLLKRANVEVRTVSAGQAFAAGDVTFEVLHPPPEGPSGTENERSLVLAVRHAVHTLLLTGDLEKSGTARVIALPPVPADVMQAPHHGSRPAFTPELRAWAQPKWVIVNRGDRYPNVVRDADAGAPVWDTHAFGAVTVRSHPAGLAVESFRTGRVEPVPRR